MSEHRLMAWVDPQASKESDRVLLVHGYLRTGLSMRRLGKRLSAAGFEVHRVTQRNFNRTIDQLADDLEREVRPLLEAAVDEAGPLHFVTHSLGGVVLRRMLSTRSFSGLGRAVLLTPPNQGSRFAEAMHDRVFRFPWRGFDPLAKVLPGEGRPCASAGDLGIDCGILAGAPPRSPTFPWIWRPKDSNGCSIPGPAGAHDGTLAVDECRLDSCTEFRVLPYSHTFFMSEPEVGDLCLRFLRTGSFSASID